MKTYMTRDYSQETSTGGGGKKFLYSGPRKRSAFDDDDSDTQKWSYTNHISVEGTNSYSSSSREKGSDFDLDGIWSIKKNIGALNKPASNKPGVQEGWDRSSNGFYSRHSGPTGGNPESSAMQTGVSHDPSGKTWPRAYNAYSYTSPSGGQPQPNAGSAALSKDFQPVTPSPRHPGAVSIHNVTSPVNVSAGGSVGFRGSARNSVHRRNPQAPQAKHFDF